MKNFAVYILFIFLGLIASIALSFILFGELHTSNGIKQLTEIVKGPDVIQQKSLLGINRQNIQNFLINNNSPVLSSYEDFQNFKKPLYPLTISVNCFIPFEV